MMLSIELENQKFLDIDLDESVYITGPNQKQMWKIFRSLYYYFNKAPQLSTNIYGDDKIEIAFDDEAMSVKNNETYFINSRESIYNQMIYKKNSLLFDYLNSQSDNIEINHDLERMNDELLKIELSLQDTLDKNSNNLKASFQEQTYLDLLKNNLMINYELDNSIYPLEFMDTEALLDEFLNFLKFKLDNDGRTVWLILYNLESFVSAEEMYNFVLKAKKMVAESDMKLMVIGNSLENIPINEHDVENIVIAADEFHQMLPFENLLETIKLHYPSDFYWSPEDTVNAIRRIAPLVGSSKKMFISSKDLVLLKVVNEVLGYETSFNLECNLLNSTETKFLKD